MHQEQPNPVAEEMSLDAPPRAQRETALGGSAADAEPAQSLSPDRDARAQGVAEMFADAHANAPRCGGVRLSWMTVAQAAAALRISKNVLSTWASRGYIASVKGHGANDHRYLHLDQVLHFLADRMFSQLHEIENTAAAQSLPTNAANINSCDQPMG